LDHRSDDLYLVRVCRSRGAYEAIPKKKTVLDLNTIEEKLVGMGYEVVCNAKVVLVVRLGEEAHIFPSGRILIKVNEEKRAKEVVRSLQQAINIG